MLTNFFFVVTRHWSKSGCKHWTLFKLLPIMQHKSVLHRALDFFVSTGNNFFVVFSDGFLERCLVGANALDGIDEIGNVTDAVVKALAAV